MALSDVISVLVIFLGIWIAWLDRHQFLAAMKSYSWLDTQGRIIELRDHSFGIDGVHPYLGTTSAGYAEIQYLYEFEVEGEKYHGCRTAFGGHNDQKGGSEYMSGDEVTVYYCLKDPNQCTLKKGVGFGSIFAYLMIATAVAWILLVERSQ